MGLSAHAGVAAWPAVCQDGDYFGVLAGPTQVFEAMRG